MLILKVYAPAAGKLKASGRGLKTVTKKLGARGDVTLRLRERRARSLKTKVSVSFTPSAGKTRKRQVKTLRVKLKARRR